MNLRPQDRERGLAALNEARQQRRRAIVFGRVRIREVATGFWLMTFAGLLLFSFAYYRYTLVELEAKRSEVLGRQRVVAAAVGTSGLQLRDRLESWVLALAEGVLPEQVAAEARLDDIAKGPSIYLRVRQAEAGTIESLRKAARGSLRDGFTSCLFVAPPLDPEHGLRCTLTSQCGPGELCGDWNRCAVPGHPYNVRLLYDGLRVLTPEWLAALDAARDELQLRAIELDLLAAGKHEAVAGVELVKQSKYFTAVLDGEAPPGPALPPTASGDSRDEQLQAIDHPVRVGIWDIARAAPLVVLNLEAAGRFVRVGAGAGIDAQVQRVQQRQANNCAVATDVRRALAAGRVPAPDESTRAGEPSAVGVE